MSEEYLEEGGGLINFLPLKMQGGGEAYYREGGLIEDLR